MHAKPYNDFNQPFLLKFIQWIKKIRPEERSTNIRYSFIELQIIYVK